MCGCDQFPGLRGHRVRCAASCHHLMTTFIESDQCHHVLTDDCSHPSNINNNNCEFDLQGSGEHYQQPPALARAAVVATPAPWFPLTLGPCSLCSVGVSWSPKDSGPGGRGKQMVSSVPGLIIQTNLKCVETENKKQKWREERKG